MESYATIAPGLTMAHLTEEQREGSATITNKDLTK